MKYHCCCCCPGLFANLLHTFGARLGGILLGVSLCSMLSAVICNIKFQLEPQIGLFPFLPLTLVCTGGVILNLIPPRNLEEDPDNRALVERNIMIALVAAILIMVGIFAGMIYAGVAFSRLREKEKPSTSPPQSWQDWWRRIFWGGTNDPTPKGDYETPVQVLISVFTATTGWLCLFMGKLWSRNLSKTEAFNFDE